MEATLNFTYILSSSGKPRLGLFKVQVHPSERLNDIRGAVLHASVIEICAFFNCTFRCSIGNLLYCILTYVRNVYAASCTQQ